MYLIEPIRNGKYLPDGALVMAMQVYVLNNIDIDETVIFPYYCELGKSNKLACNISKNLYFSTKSLKLLVNLSPI